MKSIAVASLVAVLLVVPAPAQSAPLPAPSWWDDQAWGAITANMVLAAKDRAKAVVYLHGTRGSWRTPRLTLIDL